MKKKNSAGSGSKALAALGACIVASQGSPVFASQEVDLQTLQLLREESISEKEFYDSYRKSWPNGPQSSGNYSRMGISDGNYSRMGISSANYSRMGISDGNYSRMGISNGNYSRMSISGGSPSNLVAPGEIPSPIVSFDNEQG